MVRVERGWWFGEHREDLLKPVAAPDIVTAIHKFEEWRQNENATRKLADGTYLPPALSVTYLTSEEPI